ncbi:NF041680 family putative transposase [Streptomyces sp. NPDC001832]|uniref:NF041680 family putative transposase n=1 Tax=Streptomyces sp. NPDC001832 TaxID=3154527 RepID=UPI003327EC85
MSFPVSSVPVHPLSVLSEFRNDFYACLSRRGDELFELADALLCTDGPVRTLVDLSLAPEHRRGHGSLYDGINHGRLDVSRLRRSLASSPLPRDSEGRLRIAVDISNWLRPDAPCSPQRLFCHCYGRGRGNAQMIPGWPYSVVAALESGPTSWTAPLDILRLTPADDVTTVTAAQLRELFSRLTEAGQWSQGDPKIVVVLDAGYDVVRLSFLLADLPIELVGRLRSDRVLYFPPPPRARGRNGRPPRYGAAFKFADDTTWPAPGRATAEHTDHYGEAVALAWSPLHPALTHRAGWEDHDGELPIVEGTVIRLEVDHLPGERTPKPLWLWSSATSATTDDITRWWHTFLRRFDLEHTFRMFKQTLGWTVPQLRDPRAADRWSWAVIVAYTQLRLARNLTDDLRRPWERPAPPGKLTPARVRRGFRHLHHRLSQPAAAPKPGKPGPGRPPGSKNRRPAPHHHVGKPPQTNTRRNAGKDQAP